MERGFTKIVEALDLLPERDEILQRDLPISSPKISVESSEVYCFNPFPEVSSLYPLQGSSVPEGSSIDYTLKMPPSFKSLFQELKLALTLYSESGSEKLKSSRYEGAKESEEGFRIDSCKDDSFSHKKRPQFDFSMEDENPFLLSSS